MTAYKRAEKLVESWSDEQVISTWRTIVESRGKHLAEYTNDIPTEDWLDLVYSEYNARTGRSIDE